MYINNSFTYPVGKAPISLTDGLEAMLAARSYFRENGLLPLTVGGGMIDSDSGQELRKGIYSWWGGQYHRSNNSIVLDDGVALNGEEFNCYNDIEEIMKEIILRNGVLKEEGDKDRKIIYTAMQNRDGYVAQFKLETNPKKGFMAKGYDFKQWVLKISFSLESGFISKEEAQKYNVMKTGFEECLKRGFPAVAVNNELKKDDNNLFHNNDLSR
jgi:hypothetical protein